MPIKIELSEEERQGIRARYEQRVTLKTLSKEFGYSQPFLRKVIVQAGGTIRPKGKQPNAAKDIVGATFSDRLLELEEILQESLNSEVVRTLVDYALGFNDGRTFRKIDHKYAYEGAFSQFRKDRLEASYYVMGRLWRAVYRTISHGSIRLGDYGVTEKDVQICLSNIEPADIRLIRAWVRSNIYVYLPNEVGVHKVVEACERAMKSIVNSKLRFIVQYDPAYEKDDLISFLREVAYKVALKYDWHTENGEFAFEKCVNYTKRSLWNAAFLLIKQNTSEDYRRLVRIDTDQRLYQITTISMDSPIDDEWLHIQKKLGEPEDRTLEVRDLVTKLNDKKLVKYLGLEVEDDPKFNEFVQKETGREENDLYVNDYNKWRELALRYSGISNRSERISIKRRILKGMGLWEEKSARRSGTNSAGGADNV